LKKKFELNPKERIRSEKAQLPGKKRGKEENPEKEKKKAH